jgi:NADPH-dependent 2,4-dienoyl-CoA reductase/sulfur reductase-like enzyme
MRIVVVGNGVAGMEAAQAARRQLPTATISVVSEESDHFFSRTALMYVLSGQLSHAATEPLERDAYARLGLTRVRARAAGLDPARRQLLLTGADPLPYDRLILAPGSRARPAPWPGADLPGVGSFVTLQDLAWLEEELAPPKTTDRPPNEWAHLGSGASDSPYRRRPSAAHARGRRAERPVVIGGGLIGVEVVEAMLALGRRPTFLIRDDWFWPIALDAQEAGWVADELRAHGVDARTGTEVSALEGGPSGVERVVTNKGTIEADLVVVAIGVVPNTAWLGGVVPTDRGGGLLVDASLRTAVDDVWACGDAASVPMPDGSHRTEPLWYTARAQGRIAGRNASSPDAPAPYARGTWYNSAKLMDIEYTTAGQLDGDVWRFEETGAVRSSTRIAHREGRVVGFNFLGRRWDHSVCARWIEEGRPLRYVVDHLRQAAFDTEFVPPLVVPNDRRP